MLINVGYIFVTSLKVFEKDRILEQSVAEVASLPLGPGVLYTDVWYQLENRFSEIFFSPLFTLTNGRLKKNILIWDVVPTGRVVV